MAKEDKKGGRPRINAEPNLVNKARLDAIGDIYGCDQLDKKILNLQNRYPEESHQSFADYLGVHLTTVKDRMNKPAYKAAFKDYNTSHQDLYALAIRKALRVSMQLMDSSDENTRLKACDSIFRAVKTDFNLTQVNVQNNTQRVFRSTIQEDGTLLGMVMDEELNKEVIDATVETRVEVSKEVE